MDWKRVGINPITAGIIGFLYGASSIWWALLTGTSLYSALFAFAYASIEFAFKSRELVGWIAFFSIIFVGITGWTGYRLKEREEVVWFTWFTAFVIGWTLARTVIFVLLDIWFFLVVLIFVLLARASIEEAAPKNTYDRWGLDLSHFENKAKYDYA